MELKTSELQLRKIRFILEANTIKMEKYIEDKFTKLDKTDIMKLITHVQIWNKIIRHSQKIELSRTNRDTKNIEAIGIILANLTNALENFKKIGNHTKSGPTNT